jgi:hypothetical protein
MAVIAATVSGSFHRHMSAIRVAVDSLRAHGVLVLSPADPTVVGAVGSFLFVASDIHRSVRLVQDRHLAAIRRSDFLLLVCPDGYVGQSASLEIGFALASGVPVYCTTWPSDPTLRQYVQRADTLDEVLLMAAATPRLEDSVLPLLLEPVAATQAAHDRIEAMKSSLTKAPELGGQDVADEVRRLRRELLHLVELPVLPRREVCPDEV